MLYYIFIMLKVSLMEDYIVFFYLGLPVFLFKSVNLDGFGHSFILTKQLNRRFDMFMICFSTVLSFS